MLSPQGTGGRLCLLAALGMSCAGRAEVLVTGVGEAVLANVLAHLKLDEESCDAPEWRVREAYQRAGGEIRFALQAFGFYDAELAAELDFDRPCWLASFAVEAGQPVRVRRLDVRINGEGERDLDFQSAVAGFELTGGDALRHGAYERLKRSLLDLAVERGYADAAFAESRMDVYPSELAADITVHFDTGSRYRFGNIELNQDVLADELVNAYIGFGPGDPYDNRRLNALYQALSGSGYFRSIDIRALPPVRERKEIPVMISLTPGTRRTITYGAGYSTDTGPRLRLGTNNRRRNVNGHQSGVDVELSPVVSELTVGYRFPRSDPLHEWMSLAGGLKREDTESAYSESLELGVRRVFRGQRGWARTNFVDLLAEDFEVAEQAGRSRLLTPGVAWSKVRSDNPIRPAQGARLDFEVRGALDSLGSDTTFLQVSATGKWIWSLPNAARLIVRGTLGTTAEEEFADLPPSVRFFAGGDASIRGYEFESLGPEDETGQVVGGSNLAVGSFEYEHPLRERWSIAFFIDAGNAFEGSDLDVKSGAGLGLRWHSPLGPMRIDVGFPVNDPQHEDARLHITLGPDL